MDNFPEKSELEDIDTSELSERYTAWPWPYDESIAQFVFTKSQARLLIECLEAEVRLVSRKAYYALRDGVIDDAREQHERRRACQDLVSKLAEAFR